MAPDKIAYVYVAGASFSGSTLLAFLLNAHPAMASVSEVCGVPNGHPDEERLRDYACSCGSPLLECRFYLELEHRIRESGSTFTLADWRTHFRASRFRPLDVALARPLGLATVERVRDRLAPLVPGFRRTIDEIARRNVAFARAVLEMTGKRVFVDAQKDPGRIRFLAGIDALDLRVVHLVRDVRGGAASYMKNNPRNDAARAARKWRRANVGAERARRYVASDRWLRVTYDDLCTDPRRVVDAIAAFAGVGDAPLPDDFRSSEHHIVGNRMRLTGVRDIRRDESWKQRLTPADLGIVARIGGRTNRRFGFDWP